MKAVSINHIFKGGEDVEKAQYLILADLQRVHRAFTGNAIYPYLGQVIDLFRVLQRVLQNFEVIHKANNGDMVGIDLTKMKLLYEKVGIETAEVKNVSKLINWALPLFEKSIEEGKTIFDFVSNHLQVRSVGIVPQYLNEGYLLIPNCIKKELHIYQYHVSIFTKATTKFRSLKTIHKETIYYRQVLPAPGYIKMEFLSRYRTFVNPATYFFESDLDFPFEHTILPVAKRKLLAYLHMNSAA